MTPSLKRLKAESTRPGTARLGSNCTKARLKNKMYAVKQPNAMNAYQINVDNHSLVGLNTTSTLPHRVSPLKTGTRKCVIVDLSFTSDSSAEDPTEAIE